MGASRIRAAGAIVQEAETSKVCEAGASMAQAGLGVASDSDQLSVLDGSVASAHTSHEVVDGGEAVAPTVVAPMMKEATVQACPCARPFKTATPLSMANGSHGGSNSTGVTAGGASIDFGVSGVVDGRRGNAPGGTTGHTNMGFGGRGVVDGRGGNVPGGTAGPVWWT